MALAKRNRELHIDREALATLSLLKEGVFSPVNNLMNQKESILVDKTSSYKDTFFPFSFILAPSGKRNEEVLRNIKKGENLDLIVDGEKKGYLITDESFPINKKERIEKIFLTSDLNHPGVLDMYNRLGNMAISGEFFIDSHDTLDIKQKIQEAKENLGVQKSTAIMINAKPLHRGHERMIRSALESNDLVILFLLKPHQQDRFSFEIRCETVRYFINHFLPKNRVIVLPFENTYIFAGYNNIILDGIAAKNFGCDSITIGENHSGIGIYYDQHGLNSLIKSFTEKHNIEIQVVSEYVYCDTCRTLVSTKTCPHGRHHHISYNSEFMQGLILSGVLPPAVLVRKEISAILLSKLFEDRFKDFNQKFINFFPNKGLIENMDDKKFYLKIMQLHQTVSLT